MANCCSDTVVFCDFDNLKNIKKFGEDVKKYFENKNLSECWLGGFLLEKGIDINGFSTRGMVLYHEIEENKVMLDVDSAWYPLVDAYTELAKLYNLNFVLKAEEPGCGVFINTDADGEFFPERYIAYVAGGDFEQPIASKLGEDVYFKDEQEVLKYFSQIEVKAESIIELNAILKDTDIHIYEYRNL